jgi:hypothetical protein
MKYDYGFPLMVDIVPATKPPEKDGFWIQHYEITEEEVHRQHCRLDWTMRGLEPGTYCVLHQRRDGHDSQWMSDTWLERYTNADFLKKATGHVLVIGLGIGLLPVALCRKVDVESVTVLEIEPQVIALVEPHIRHPKLRPVVQGDAFEPPPALLSVRYFDAVYADIWADICSDNWETMKPLLALYRKAAKKGALVTAWLKDYIQAEHKATRQRYGGYW